MGHLLSGLPPEHKRILHRPVVPPCCRNSPPALTNQHPPQRLAAQGGTKTLHRGAPRRAKTLVAARTGARNFFQIGRSCVTLAPGIFRLPALVFAAPAPITPRLFTAMGFAVERPSILPLPAPTPPPRRLAPTPSTAIPLRRINGKKTLFAAFQQAFAMTGTPLLAAFCLRYRFG